MIFICQTYFLVKLSQKSTIWLTNWDDIMSLKYSKTSLDSSKNSRSYVSSRQPKSIPYVL